jgi:hypothetical protein
MNTRRPEIVPDASDWSPSALASTCLQARCVKEPAIVIPVLGEFIENHCQSDDSQLRETSLRCLGAVFGATQASPGIFS